MARSPGCNYFNFGHNSTLEGPLLLLRKTLYWKFLEITGRVGLIIQRRLTCYLSCGKPHATPDVEGAILLLLLLSNMGFLCTRESDNVFN